MDSNNRLIKCGLQNIQSVGNKTEAIRELINEQSLDILILCETWRKVNDKENKITINKMLPSTHTFHHIPRPREDNRGYGGVGIFLS